MTATHVTATHVTATHVTATHVTATHVTATAAPLDSTATPFDAELAHLIASEIGGSVGTWIDRTA